MRVAGVGLLRACDCVSGFDSVDIDYWHPEQGPKPSDICENAVSSSTRQLDPVVLGAMRCQTQHTQPKADSVRTSQSMTGPSQLPSGALPILQCVIFCIYIHTFISYFSWIPRFIPLIHFDDICTNIQVFYSYLPILFFCLCFMHLLCFSYVLS